MKQRYLEIGKIITSHGVKGEMKVEPWCDSAEFLCDFETLYLPDGPETADGQLNLKAVEIESARVNKEIAIMKFKGIDTPEAVRLLRNCVLLMDREDVELEEGCYFQADLLGLAVVDADSERIYGRITQVLETGANDVYVIESASGGPYYLPAVAEMVVETDIEGELMRVRPIPGIFDGDVGETVAAEE